MFVRATYTENTSYSAGLVVYERLRCEPWRPLGRGGDYPQAWKARAGGVGDSQTLILRRKYVRKSYIH